MKITHIISTKNQNSAPNICQNNLIKALLDFGVDLEVSSSTRNLNSDIIHFNNLLHLKQLSKLNTGQKTVVTIHGDLHWYLPKLCNYNTHIRKLFEVFVHKDILEKLMR